MNLLTFKTHQYINLIIAAIKGVAAEERPVTLDQELTKVKQFILFNQQDHQWQARLLSLKSTELEKELLLPLPISKTSNMITVLIRKKMYLLNYLRLEIKSNNNTMITISICNLRN